MCLACIWVTGVGPVVSVIRELVFIVCRCAYMETTIIGHISCSFGVRDVVFCIRIPVLIKCYVQILMRTVLICVLDYGP